MNIILLSGGSGKRLWPLSNDVRSKQFLKIFPKEDGSRESMAQRMFRMIKEVDPNSVITIATSENQIQQIKAQLGDNVGISVEPTRRDTFPAIALAAAYLKKNGVNENEPIVVCPVDPYVDIDYFHCLSKLSDAASEKNAANIVLMGIEPTYPSEKFGYIIPVTKETVSAVSEFKEKPDKQTAQKYISIGALWNGGVFAFKLSYLLNISAHLLGTNDYDTMFKNYASLRKISFDYAVVEKEKSIDVIRFSGKWKDLGTWNTLSEAMKDSFSGKVMTNHCLNTHIINELDVPLIALGIDNSIVVATPDGILVSKKSESVKLKDYVNDMIPMYEQYPWGEYKILDYSVGDSNEERIVRKLIIKANNCFDLSNKDGYKEIITVENGQGTLTINGDKKNICSGDSFTSDVSSEICIKAHTEMQLIDIKIRMNK